MTDGLKGAVPNILVLAPTGIDARLTCEYFATTGLKSYACENLEDLCLKLSDDCGVAVICEEALVSGGERMLAASLQQQPSWSEIPLVILLPRVSRNLKTGCNGCNGISATSRCWSAPSVRKACWLQCR